MSVKPTALVTGAGRGIGLAIARGLAAHGFKVAMASLEHPAPAAVSSVLATDCRYYPFDVADLDAHAGLVQAVEADLGPIACLVNNAGVSSLSRGDMLDLTTESFDRAVNVNLRGTFFLTQAVARRMIARRPEGGVRSIVTIGSANAAMIGESRADYCITKAGLAMLSQLFAARLGEHDIGVYEVRPGIIETQMTAAVRDKYDPYIRSGGVPMRRWGQAEDVARVVVTVATGGLPFATGTHIDVGGGLHLHRLNA